MITTIVLSALAALVGLFVLAVIASFIVVLVDRPGETILTAGYLTVGYLIGRAIFESLGWL